ncbi:hypothetical protein SMC26_35035 [Actinomadura fulvescens]|uniref:Uncharacterized protein n=1 Tax=Actinomadura fulvescens TaxID=46160 RepID=A0ABP6DAW8_9ACTN
MTEVADQLVLEYLGKVADAAHGELSSRERLDFCNRLRRRIDEHRHGSTDPRRVRQVLARFGDPTFLVARERRRLDEIRAATDSAAAGDGEVRTPERASKADANDTAQDAQDDAGDVQGGLPQPKPRAPVPTVRGGGRTTRRFTWSPSGAVQLRRERRKEKVRGPFARVMAALRGARRVSFRRRSRGTG